MSNSVFVGRQVASISRPPAFDPISKVIVKVDTNNAYIAGDDTGRTIEITCPYGNQVIADNLLAELGGYVYKPMAAVDALIDPAAELGDPVTVDGVYTVLAKMRTSFGALMTSEISAPGQEEIESEYPHMTNEVKIQYQLATTRSLITKTAEEIRLEIIGVENAFSSLELEVDSITSRVQGIEGNFSALEQTVNGFDARVEDVELGLSSTISVDADGILISNEDGSKLEIDGGQLKAETVTAYRLQADMIRMRTSAGTTVARFYLDEADTAEYKMEIYADAMALIAEEGFIHIASGSVGSTSFLQARPGAIVVGGTFRPNVDADSEEESGVDLGTASKRWLDIYAANATIQTSDQNRKKDIEYGLSEYDALFDGLAACTYRMVNGHDRKHWGFVAQDIEVLLEKLGIDTMDAAVFIKAPREDGDGFDYGLRYGEFIALIIDQVQKLKKRVSELEGIA